MWEMMFSNESTSSLFGNQSNHIPKTCFVEPIEYVIGHKETFVKDN